MTPDEKFARARRLEFCADRLRFDAIRHSQPAYDVGAVALDTLAYDLRRDARLELGAME